MEQQTLNTITSPSQIELFQLKTLAAGLKLEVKGMKKTGRSCYAIAKEHLNIRGDKEYVLTKLNEKIKEFENGISTDS